MVEHNRILCMGNAKIPSTAWKGNTHRSFGFIGRGANISTSVSEVRKVAHGASIGIIDRQSNNGIELNPIGSPLNIMPFTPSRDDMFTKQKIIGYDQYHNFQSGGYAIKDLNFKRAGDTSVYNNRYTSVNQEDYPNDPNTTVILRLSVTSITEGIKTDVLVGRGRQAGLKDQIPGSDVFSAYNTGIKTFKNPGGEEFIPMDSLYDFTLHRSGDGRTELFEPEHAFEIPMWMFWSGWYASNFITDAASVIFNSVAPNIRYTLEVKE